MTAIHNFAPEDFPIVLEAIHPETRVVVWTETIEQPDQITALHVPPLERQLGHPVVMRARYGQGAMIEEPA